MTDALNSTYRGASKLPDEILAVEGYSSPFGPAPAEYSLRGAGCAIVVEWALPTGPGRGRFSRRWA